MSSRPQYWLCITSESNFELDRERKFPITGFTERNKSFVKKFRLGDRIVYYINGISKFGAILEVTSEYFRSEEKVWADDDELWPSRVRTRPLIVLDKEQLLDARTIKDSLSFVPNSSHWGIAFMGSIRSLPEEDFLFIESEMRKSQMVSGSADDEARMPQHGEKTVLSEEHAIDLIMGLDLKSKSLHDRLGEMLASIGLRMNYNAITRYPITPEHSYELDVAWLRGKNPEVAMEVQINGNITEAKERLAQAKRFNYRKVIMVIEKDQLRKLNDIIKFDELKNWLEAWSIPSVYLMYQASEQFFPYYNRLVESRYVEKSRIELI